MFFNMINQLKTITLEFYRGEQKYILEISASELSLKTVGELKKIAGKHARNIAK